MWWLMLASAQAPEVVTVWQKSFARFDDKRWHVVSEVVTPSHVQMGTQKNPLKAGAWQLETVIHCQMESQRGGLREADCEVEQAAVRVHTPRFRAGGRQEQYLRAFADELVGTNLQLQVSRKGPVPNHDLDGLRENSTQDRARSEGVRTMMHQIAGAFHMEFSRNSRLGENWVSYKDPLLHLTTSTRGMAGMEIVHRMDPLDGMWIHQSRGRSTASAPLSNPNAGMLCRTNYEVMGVDGSTRNNLRTGQQRADEMEQERSEREDRRPGVDGALGVGVGAGLGTGSGTAPQQVDSDDPMPAKDSRDAACGRGMNSQPEVLASEVMYSLELDSVAVIDPKSGYPIERVWSVHGKPTASSPGALTATNYWGAGKLRELREDEVVQLGSTGLIGPPGQVVEGLPTWVSVAD